MGNHQISELLTISMGKLKEMIDVDIVIGQPIVLGSVSIIPVSEVKCGMLSGGFDQKKLMSDTTEYPFGGGAGGTWSVKPIAFLAIKDDQIEVLHLHQSSHVLEKIIDNVGELLDKMMNSFQKPKTFASDK